MPICRTARAVGSNWICGANLKAPKTCTWATPLTVEIDCAISDSAYSSTEDSGCVSELSAILSTGASAGLDLLYEGGAGMSLGKAREACEIAAWTSCAAP